MAGGIYKRSETWWCWWTERVKDPKTGRLKSKKKYASSQSKRRSDAVTLLSTKIHEARLQKPRLDLPDPTYEEVRDLWTASKPNTGKRKDGTAYFDGRTHLDAFFSGWRAKDIDTPDIIALQDKLREKGLGNGIDHAVVSLRTMLNYAVNINRLRREQLPGSFPMLRFKRKPPRPIDEDLVEPICEHLPEPFKSGFILSYHTGMRLSEVERLRWDQVILAKRCLYFPSAKTREERLVPLLAGTEQDAFEIAAHR